MNPVLGQVYNPYGGAPPVLPVGWVENYTATGQPYWYNTMTHQSSWVYPTMMAPMTVKQPVKKKKQIKKKIPGTNWLFVITHDGYEFYYDRDTKTSVWEQPESLKEPMEELKRLEEKEKQEKEERKEEENKKRMLEEEGEAEEQEAKRVKSDQEEKVEKEKEAEEEETTEMTEEDIMWQLQQMAEEEVELDQMEGGESAEAEAIEAEQNQQDQQQLTETKEEEIKEQPKKAEEIKEEKEKKVELSEQERIDKFYELLKENNISPFAVYSVELPKLMIDPRFSMVPNNKQKNLFNKYCHELGEQIKKEKSKVTKKPEDEFRELLESKVTQKMYWDDFRRKFKDDPRFKALQVTREKEALFKHHIRNNLNKKRNPVEEYKNLLSHIKEIQKDTRWRDAKKILEKYDVYHAIEDKDQREDLFRDYLEQL